MTTIGSPEFRKSSFSPTDNCVEVALLPDGGAQVRNSREPAGAVLTYTSGEWAAFLAGAKAGEFDHLI
jgi:Domain of unknown function (DUF397)